MIVLSDYNGAEKFLLPDIHIAEKEVKRKETAREEKEELRKFAMKNLAEAFADLSMLLKNFEE
jgi:hypothetical protein